MANEMLKVGEAIEVRGSVAIVTFIELHREGRERGEPRFIHYTNESGVRDVCAFEMFTRFGSVTRYAAPEIPAEPLDVLGGFGVSDPHTVARRNTYAEGVALRLGISTDDVWRAMRVHRARRAADRS